MQDCMNRQGMELASASTSTAVPAAKRRGPVAALIAALIVAAALLFAMPSLAYASAEAETAPQGAASQEVLLSEQGSSKSVNKTPDEPKTPPAYTQQDAYKSTSASTASGVEVVSGGSDSSDSGYTTGDNKSSVNDKDSDSDSDSASEDSTYGTENEDDSTLNKGDDTSDNNSSNDSTDDSNGASSGSTDENATDNNQSAVPNGSDSKADDVIATPGDKESADQNAGTTSDKTEEVYGPYLPYSESGSNSTTTNVGGITTQDTTVTLHFNTGWDKTAYAALPSSSKTGNVYDAPGSAGAASMTKWGNDNDPVFDGNYNRLMYNGSPVSIGDTLTIAAADFAALNIANGIQIHGHVTTTSTPWVFIVKQSNAAGTSSQYKKLLGPISKLMDSNFTKGLYSEIHVYPYLDARSTSISVFYEGNSREIAATGGLFNATVTLPVHSDGTNPATNNGDGTYGSKKLVWYICRDTSDESLQFAKENGFYITDTQVAAGMTTGDVVNAKWNFRSNTGAMLSLTLNGETLLQNPAGFVLMEAELKEDISFTVTYNANGGSLSLTPNPQTYTDSGATLPTTVPTRAGYDFQGWAYTSTATTGVKTGTIQSVTGMPTISNGGAYTLYAIWAVQKMVVTFNQNYTGSPAATTKNVDYGGNTTAAAAPTRTGYTFDGWYANAAGTGTKTEANGAINNVTSNLTFYAKWVANPTITYNLNSGTATGITNTSVAPGGSHTVTSVTPTRTGYKFTGWLSSQDNQVKQGGATISNITSNLTLTAQWSQLLTYVYNANKPSGALSSTNPSGVPTTGGTVASGESFNLATGTPTLTGYTFAGWNTAANGTGTSVAAGGSTSITAATTFYAQWTENTGYTINFVQNYPGATSDVSGGTSLTGLKWSQTATLANAPTAPLGYSWNNWYVQQNRTASGTAATASASTMTTSFAQLWEKANALGYVNASTKTITLYGNWTKLTDVQLILNPNGGTYNGTTNNHTINVLNGTGSTGTIPTNIANPTKTGYVFKGWGDNTTTAKYNAGDSVTVGTSNKTIYAVWEAAKITINFEKGSGVTGVTALKGDPYTTTVNYGTSFTVDAGNTVYTRPGYAFTNWSYTNASGAAATVGSAGSASSLNFANVKIVWNADKSAGTITLSANWGPFTYNIAWNGNGNTTHPATPGVTNVNSVQAGATVTLPTAPTRPGYTFKGWNTAANGSGSAITGGTVSSVWNLSGVNSGSTLNAYAQWEENKVTITFNGASPSIANVKYGSTGTPSNSITLYVGAATGNLYDSATATTPNGKNISSGIYPNFVNTNYEYNATHGAKWTSGSATGTTVTSGVSSTGVFTPQQNSSKVYTAGTYYLTAAPKYYTYTVEYYIQPVTGSTYTKLDTPAVTNGSAPFGQIIQVSTTAGTNGNLTTIVRDDSHANLTGFHYNNSHANKVESIVIGATAANNVIKLYYDRNEYTVTISYTGTVPPGFSYTPATQTVKYGATVTVNTPAASSIPSGYVWNSWHVVSGGTSTVNDTRVNSGSFLMPNNNVVIEGEFAKQTYNVLFKTDSTTGNYLQGTSYQVSKQLEFGETLDSVPTATPKDINNYYFMGWELYEGSETAANSKGVFSAEELLGSGLNPATPWTCPATNVIFVARFGKTIAINYTPGAAVGAFADKAGRVDDDGNKGSLAILGTTYTQLQLGWDVPIYGGALDATGDRNSGNPHAAAGYKFVGWEWVDALNGNVTKRALGHYTGTGKNATFVWESGDMMPTTIEQSLTFVAIWEETTQHLHFDVSHSNLTGVTGAPATDVALKTGAHATLPVSPSYTAATNASGYKFLGWTTDYNYVKNSSPLYNATNRFDMTAGTKNASVYTLGDYGYGVTLYPVFEENTVTIKYDYATGSTSLMGNLSKNTETINAVSGTAAGSNATANTGYTFHGWYSDAAHTVLVSSTPNFVPTKSSGVYAGATYYAYFTINSYDITFKIGDHGTWTAGGTADKTTKLDYNTTYGTNVPSVKPNTGYSFQGWVDQNGTQISDAALKAMKVGTSNMTFTAVWQEKDSFNLNYNLNGGQTASGATTIASHGVKWTDDLNTVMKNEAKSGLKMLGYTFDGWYAKADLSAASKLPTGAITFETALRTLVGNMADVDEADITLYAKWTPREITIHYVPAWPNGNTTTYADKIVTWNDVNLLKDAAGVDFSTLTASGYTFTKWAAGANATAAKGNTAVSNTTKVSDLYKALYGSTDNTKTEITLYGIWGDNTFTVQFKDDTGAVKNTVSDLKWTSTVNYFNYVPSDSKRLIGWKYTPAGGTEQTWTDATTPLLVSALAGNNGDARTLVLTGVYENNAHWVINFNKVGIDDAGNIQMGTSTKVSSEAGYIQKGNAINIESFNGHNFPVEFENNNGAGRRTDLTGYVLDKLISNLTASAADVDAAAAAGTDLVFNVYWVEQLFTITYLPGKVSTGAAAPSDLTMPADKTVAWTSTNLAAGTNPEWEGYKFSKWQYKKDGVWTNVPTGAKFSDLAISSDPSVKLELAALWETDTVRITYTTQMGGTASNGAGFNIAANGSDYQDIKAVGGTPYTMTATANAGYKFIGWYQDGTLLTTDATFTPVPDASGMFSTTTYQARFETLGAITYNIEHYYENLAGGFDMNKTTTGTGMEFSTVTVSNGMLQNVKGWTYTPGMTGSVETIASLTAGQTLKLFYTLNEYEVFVNPAPMGSDNPGAGNFTVTWTPSISQDTTKHKFGESLVLPTVTAEDGWKFKWSIDYIESDGGRPATSVVDGGYTFTMPDGEVTIVGVWTRDGHTVTFTPGTPSHGTVTTINGKTQPFTVSHGKNLNDPSATGNSNDIKVTPDEGWSFAGWTWRDANGNSGTAGMDPNSVTINADTIFEAIWAQTFHVIYFPGDSAHAGDAFKNYVLAEDDIEAGTKTVADTPLMIGGVNMTANAPAANGYRFVGWTWKQGGASYYWIAPTASDYDTSKLAGSAGTMDFTINGNVEFYAVWDAMGQDLIYKLDDAQSSWNPNGPAAGATGDTFVTDPKPATDSTVTLMGGNSVSRPGHNFAGWAIWNDLNGDGQISEIELTKLNGFSYKIPAGPTILVPTWSFSNAGINYVIAPGSTGMGTLSRPSETIASNSVQQAQGSTATPNMGYVVSGWYLDADCTMPVDMFWVTGDTLADGRYTQTCAPYRPDDGIWTGMTLYVKFEAGRSTVVIEHLFQQADGSYVVKKTDEIKNAHTGDYIDLNDPAYADYILKAGHELMKGYEHNAGKGPLAGTVNANGGLTLKVHYDLTKFSITYILDETGAEVTSANWNGQSGRPTATVGTNVTIPGVHKDGYRHIGWTVTWTDADGVAGYLELPAEGATFPMPFANVTATATWKKLLDVTVEYWMQMPDGTEVLVEGATPETVPNYGVAGETYDVNAANPEFIGKYRPAGYSNPGSVASIVLSELDPSQNVVRIVYQMFRDFQIHWNANGGASDQTTGGLGLDSEVTDGGITLPTMTGHHIKDMPNRWNSAADGSGVWLEAGMTYAQLAEKLLGAGYDEQTLRTNGLTLFAQYDLNNDYTVKFDLNNGSENPNIGNKVVPGHRNPLAIQDITGVTWTQDGFNLYNDEELDAAPAGYEFIGWNTQRDGKGLTITDATKYFEISNAIDRNVEQKVVTLYAMWRELEIEIKYITTEGGTIDRELDKVSAATGQHVSTGSSAGDRLQSVATAKPGYHFVRWELVDTATGRTIGVDENHWEQIGDGNTIKIYEPEADGRLVGATYRAVFEKNEPATITYDVNGGEGSIDPVTTSWGLSVNLHNGTGIKRGHYTLVGWNTAPDGSGTTYGLGRGVTMPEGGMQLYAMWEMNSYTVNVKNRHDHVADVNGGKTKVVWGEPLPESYINSIKQTPKQGSTFAGWKYRMTDADTGEVIEGVVWDLSELTVLGPIEIEALYETEDLVTEGATLPKTGDEGLFGIILALLAAAVALILIVLVARRRRDEDEVDGFDPDGTRAPRARAAAGFTAVAELLDARFAHAPDGSRARAGTLLARYARRAAARVGSHATDSHKQANNATTQPGGVVHVMGAPGAHSYARPQAFPQTLVIVGVTALALAFTLGAAPGLALAQTGDPGADATTNNSISTHHQNTPDPATNSTGSAVSKQATTSSQGSASSASASGSSSASSASGASGSSASSGSSSSGSTTSASRPSNSSAGSVSSSSNAGSASANHSSSYGQSGTTTAARDEIVRLTARNKLAFGSSSVPSSSSSASVSRSASVANQSASCTRTASSFAATAAADPASTDLLAATMDANAEGGIVVVSADAACAAGASNAGALLGATDKIAGASAAGSGQTGVGTVLGADGRVQDADAPLDSALDVADVPEMPARKEDEALTCDAALASGEARGLSGSSAGLLNGLVGAEGDLAFPTLTAANDDAVIDETPGENTDSISDDTIVENFDGSEISNEGESDVDIVPGEGDEGAEMPSEPEQPEVPVQPEVPKEPEQPEVPESNKPVQITYGSTQGGYVTNKSETMDPITGSKPSVDDADAANLDGTSAHAHIGYHFTGWTVADPTATDPSVPTDPSDPSSCICDSKKLDSATIMSNAISGDKGIYQATKFISTFKANTYKLTYDANGGTTASGASALDTITTATFGKNDTLSATETLTRDGLEFVGWNTSRDGSGVPVQAGDVLTTSKLRAMVLESATNDADGAGITLYAQWRDPAPEIVNEPDVLEPTETKVNALRPLPGEMTHEEIEAFMAALSKASPAQRAAVAQLVAKRAAAMPVAAASAMTESEATEEQAPEDEASILDVQTALSLPPALEVLPAAAERFVTVSSEALTGISEGGAAISAADATTAVAAVAGAVGVVAVGAGIAGAAASATARRRVANLHGPSGIEK